MEAYTGRFVSRKRESHTAQAIQPRNLQMQAGKTFCRPNPKSEVPSKVRRRGACRGLRAWHAKKGPFGTKETRGSPAALTTRAKREGRSNDKEDQLRGRRESDRFIVAQGKAQAPT